MNAAPANLGHFTRQIARCRMRKHAMTKLNITRDSRASRVQVERNSSAKCMCKFPVMDDSQTAD